MWQDRGETARRTGACVMSDLHNIMEQVPRSRRGLGARHVLA